MSKFFLYGGMLGAVAALSVIGLLWFQMNRLSNMADQLREDLSRAEFSIEMQNEAIEETARQQNIVNRNIRNLNTNVQEIGRRPNIEVNEDLTVEQATDTINSIFGDIERATR